MAIPRQRVVVYVYERAPGFRARAWDAAAARYPGLQILERNPALHDGCEAAVEAVYVEAQFANVATDYRVRDIRVITDRELDGEVTVPTPLKRRPGRPRKVIEASDA